MELAGDSEWHNRLCTNSSEFHFLEKPLAHHPVFPGGAGARQQVNSRMRLFCVIADDWVLARIFRVTEQTLLLIALTPYVEPTYSQHEAPC